MTHRANQSEVDDISSKLKFVAKIQPDQRVNVKNSLSLHDKNSWTVRFWRTYKGNEGRQATYEFVKELIDRAYELLSSLRHSVSDYDLEVYKKIVTELIQIEPGLRNLTKTYHKDDEYITTIETLIDSLKIKIRELCDYKNIDSVALTAQVQINLDESEAISDEDTEKKKINKAFTSSGSDSSESDQNSLRNSEEWTDGEEGNKKNTDLNNNESESDTDCARKSDTECARKSDTECARKSDTECARKSDTECARKSDTDNNKEINNDSESEYESISDGEYACSYVANKCKSQNACESQIDTHCAIESVNDANSSNKPVSNTLNAPVSNDNPSNLSEDTLLTELINSFKDIDWVDNGIQNTPYYNNFGKYNDCKSDCKTSNIENCGVTQHELINRALTTSYIDQFNANPPKEESFIKLIAENGKQMDENNTKIIPDTVLADSNIENGFTEVVVKNLSNSNSKLPAIETDEALLEILNKVNLGARRRGKRKKTGNQDAFFDVECQGQQCQGQQSQGQGQQSQCQVQGQVQGQKSQGQKSQGRVSTAKSNPYNVLKYDFTYDLESGLQLPRAPLLRNAPNESTQLKKKVV